MLIAIHTLMYESFCLNMFLHSMYIQYYKIFILQLNYQFRRKDSHINVWKLIEHSLNASFKGLSTFYTFDPQIPVCCHFRKRIFKASQKSSFNRNGQALQIIAFKNVDDSKDNCYLNVFLISNNGLIAKLNNKKRFAKNKILVCFTLF